MSKLDNYIWQCGVILSTTYLHIHSGIPQRGVVSYSLASSMKEPMCIQILKLICVTPCIYYLSTGICRKKGFLFLTGHSLLCLLTTVTAGNLAKETKRMKYVYYQIRSPSVNCTTCLPVLSFLNYFFAVEVKRGTFECDRDRLSPM